MNYYDEEITISGPDSKHLSSLKVDRLPSGRGSAARSTGGLAGGVAAQPATSSRGARGAERRRNMLHDNSTDDDGLLQDIIDHDDEAEDSEDDSELQPVTGAVGLAPQAGNQRRSSANPPQSRPQTRPGSTRGLRTANVSDDDEDEPTDSDTDEALNKHKRQKPPHQHQQQQQHQPARLTGAATGHAPTADVQLSLTPDKWEQLPLQAEVKELFPYILKYTPQNIEAPYHLQPFMPDYVPAVGDVDAFLKVNAPPLLQPPRAQEVGEHLQRMGIHVLDEPSGTQSEPSLLNMKLRSVLTGGGHGANNRRTASATLVPTAKTPKDIDKWIVEVEQVHMTQSVYDTQPRKDIDALAVDWPRAYALAGDDIENAYQQALQEQLPLGEYVRLLSQRFGVAGPLDTQADYMLNVQTLFGLYLAANQAWE